MELLENPLFLMPFASGLIFVAVGIFTHYFPPKKINSLYGYRTVRSMKSQEAWDFAQRFSSILSIKSGALLALSSLLGVFFNFEGKTNMILGFVLLFTMVFFLIFLTEKELKKRFD